MVRAGAVDWVARTYAVRLEVGELDYDLSSLTVWLRDVRVAADHDTGRPFFEARTIHAVLGTATLWGTTVVERLALDSPRITIALDESGASNLPTATTADDDGAGAAAEFEAHDSRGVASMIGSLDVDDLDVIATHAGIDLGLELHGLDIDAVTSGGSLDGSLTLRGNGAVTVGDRRTTVTEIDARVRVDDDVFRIDELRIATPDARLTTDLTVAGLGEPGAARLDGRYTLGADAAWLAATLQTSQPVGGTIAVTGTISGTSDEPVGEAELRGQAVQWARLDGIDVAASTRIDASGLDLRSLAVTAGGASITAYGRVPFGEDERIEATVDWEDLSTSTLALAFPTAGWSRVSTRGSGRLVFDGRGAALADVRLTLDARNRSAPGPGTPLSGFVTLETRDGQLDATFAQDARDSFSVRGRVRSALDPDTWMSSTLSGRVDATSGSLEGLAAEPFVSDWLPSAVADLAGGARLGLDLAGTIARPTFEGPLEANDLRYDGRLLGDLSTGLRGGSDHIDLEGLRLANGLNVLAASATIRLDDAAIDATFDLDAPDLASMSDTPPPAWWPSGRGTARGTITGNLGDPTVEATVAAGPLSVAGQRIDSLTGLIRLVDDVVIAERVEAAGYGAARLDLEARYDMASGRYTVTASGNALALTALPVPVGTDLAIPLAASVGFELSGEGTLDDPRASGTVRLDDAVIGGRRIGTVLTDVTIDETGVGVESVVPDLSTTVIGRMALGDESTFVLSVALDDLDLSRLDLPSTDAPDGGVAGRLSGTLAATARLWGALGEPGALQAELSVARLEALVGASRLVLDTPARLTYSSSAIDVDRLQIRAGATRATLEGRLAEDSPLGLRLTIEGRLDDLADALRTFPQPSAWPVSDLDGAFALEARATGTPIDPVATAALRLDDGVMGIPGITHSRDIDVAGIADASPVSNIRIRASYDDTALEVTDVTASWQGAQVTGRLRVPRPLLPFGDATPSPAVGADDRATLSLRVDSISAEAMAPFIGADLAGQIDAGIDSVLELSATGWSATDLAGELRLTRADAAIGAVRFGQQRPSIVRLADGRVEIVDWAWEAAGNEVLVAGGLDLTRDNGLDLTIRGEMDLRFASAFLPDMATAGHASVNVRLTGSPVEPLATGYAAVAGAEMRLATPRLIVTEVDGAFALTNDRIQVIDLTGLANGGALRITGDLTHTGLAEWRGALEASAQGVALDFPTGLRSDVEAAVRLALTPSGSTLSGHATMQRGSYREPLSVTTQLLSTLDQRALVTRAAAAPSPIDDVRLDVQISTSDDIFVDNNYGRFSLGGDVRLIGTIGRPALSGRTALREGGVIRLGGNVYQLEAGSIDFTDPTRIDPELDLRARTRISEYDVRLRLSGTPDTLETELTSDPVLGQSDIVSLLLTGRTLADAGNTGAEVARDQILSYLSGEFVGVAGRAIGLDVLRLDRSATTAEDVRFDSGLVATETNPGARLTFGKRLNQDLELIFSQSLQRSGDFTWIVDYSPFRRTDVRFVSRDNEDRSYQFWHDLSFGGGAPVSRRTSRETVERIGTIQIAGQPGFGEADLRARLRLSSGDRFDFYRWQADRDRLLRFYHDLGFLEATVRTRREAVDDSGLVTIRYDVDRGPACLLLATGATLPGSLAEAMRDRWTRSTFDEFLTQDLTRMARLRLASDGYAQAVVEPVIALSEDGHTKTIDVRIDQGPAFDRFEIVFSGAAIVDANRLQALVSATGRRTAFVNADPLIDEVIALLRSEGLLNAAVSVGAPTFVGTTASLPVVIREGQPFSISDVVLTGVESRAVDEVRRLLDVPTGSRFSEERLETARRTLSIDYRRLGFNAVEVRLATEPDPTLATVQVRVIVDEGPRQVLEEMVVEGANQTRPGLINRRLGFTIGEPIDLQAWYRARKRLYDTGAFRRVDLEFEPLAPEASVDAATTEPIRARVLVEEWPRYRLRYGFQVDDERAPTGSTGRTLSPGIVADLVRRNLFGRAFTAGLATRLERRDRTGRTFLSMPSLWGLPVTSNIFLSRSRTEFGDTTASPFITTKSDITLEQRFGFGSTTRIAYGYNYQRSHTLERDPDPQSPIPFDIQVSTARLTAAITIDTRDDLFEATRGWFHVSSIEYASEVLGSDLRFGKYLMQQYYFHPLPGGVVLASAVRAGVIDAFGQETIPSERFFAGGGNTVRGYAEDSLGEVDFFGGARGGDALFIVNQEIRVPVLAWLQGVGFVDAGRPFAAIRDFSLSKLDASVGFGVRVRTPLVMVRVDYAQPLSRVDGARPGGRWFFSIGQLF